MDDLISRQAVFNTVTEYRDQLCEIFGDENELIRVVDIVKHRLIALPSIQPEREVARMVIGKSKGGVTLWSECNKCGEPVDPDDNFCRNCGRRFVIDE